MKILVALVLLFSFQIHAQNIPDTSKILFKQIEERIANNTANGQDFYNRGIIYKSIGDTAKAILDYKKSISLETDRKSATLFAAYTNLASIEQNQKKFKKATEHFDLALELRPKDSYALNNRGFLAQVQHQYEKAIPYFKEAIKRDELNSKPYVNLVDVYLELKMGDEALAVLNELVEHIQGPRSFIHRADYYQQIGKMNAALRDWNLAVEASKNDPDFLIERSKFKDDVIYDEKGAIEDCEMAIALNPNKASYYYALARPYYDLQDYMEVIKQCEKAIEMDPELITAIVMRANVLDMFGKPEQAKGEYLKAIRISPNDYDAYRQLAVVYVAQKQYDSAMVWVDKYLSINDRNFDMVEQRAKLLVTMGDIKGSVVGFKKMIELAPTNPMGYYFVGVASDSLGKDGEACEFMKKAYDLGLRESFVYLRDECPDLLDPNMIEQSKLMERAFMLEQARNYREAVEVLDKLIAIAPDSALYYYNRGKQKRYLELHHEAIKDYKKALKRDSSYSDIWISLAVSQQYTEDIDGAMKSYQSAMRADPTNAMTYYNLGNLYGSKGNFETAIDYLNLALEYNVNYANAYMSLGECYGRLKMNAMACNSFRMAEKMGVSEAFVKRLTYCKD